MTLTQRRASERVSVAGRRTTTLFPSLVASIVLRRRGLRTTSTFNFTTGPRGRTSVGQLIPPYLNNDIGTREVLLQEMAGSAALSGGFPRSSPKDRCRWLPGSWGSRWWRATSSSDNRA